MPDARRLRRRQYPDPGRAHHGIIDFSFCGPGDPAQDWRLDRQLREAFAQRVFRYYPALRGHRRRAQFYRGNYALIQALYALRDDDAAEFEDGIADYR